MNNGEGIEEPDMRNTYTVTINRSRKNTQQQCTTNNTSTNTVIKGLGKPIINRQRTTIHNRPTIEEPDSGNNGGGLFDERRGRKKSVTIGPMSEIKVTATAQVITVDW